ncbi:hypothetical protein FXO38_00372 [Capsicum annuum]|nr:hypothetical protein FXO38_00372 [Capsicum annuum]KAF3685653.1 hypothetical protein FXO37_00405 [Capsicum annuum]
MNPNNTQPPFPSERTYTSQPLPVGSQPHSWLEMRLQGYAVCFSVMIYNQEILIRMNNPREPAGSNCLDAVRLSMQAYNQHRHRVPQGLPFIPTLPHESSHMWLHLKQCPSPSNLKKKKCDRMGSQGKRKAMSESPCSSPRMTLLQSQRLFGACKDQEKNLSKGKEKVDECVVVTAKKKKKRIREKNGEDDGVSSKKKHKVSDQLDAQIDKFSDRMDDLIDGESSRAPGKALEVHEIEHPGKQTPPAKEVRKKQSIKTTSPARPNQKLTLNEMQEKEYPFLNFDIAEIFNELLKHKLIDLLEMKQPNEAGRTNDPNYCKYHRLVGHPLEKCFVFKDKVMQLENKKKIFFDDEKANSHQISITFSSLNSV